jgi:hypothetical protein
MLTPPDISATAVAQTADARYLWNEIVRWTFEACILRKQGSERKVAELLQERLPVLIRAWSKRCGNTPDACKQQLRSLFSRAQESVEIGFIQRRLIVEEVCARLGQAPQAVAARLGSTSVQLRRRVPIGNVSDMLDALAEAEFEMMGEAVLPVRSAIAASSAEGAPEFAGETAAQMALCA